MNYKFCCISICGFIKAEPNITKSTIIRGIVKRIIRAVIVFKNVSYIIAAICCGFYRKMHIMIREYISMPVCQYVSTGCMIYLQQFGFIDELFFAPYIGYLKRNFFCIIRYGIERKIIHTFQC